MTTVIIGAGVAGLTAAIHLAARGLPVRLLEADHFAIGGRLWGGPPLRSAPVGLPNTTPAYPPHIAAELAAVTVTLRGHTHTFWPEHGIHGLWHEYHHLRAMMRRFELNVPVRPARVQAWIHGAGDWVREAEVGHAISHAAIPAPLHYLEMFANPNFLYMLGPRDWLSLLAVWNSLLLALALDPFANNITLPGQTLDDFLRGWSPRLRALFVGLARSGLASSPEKISLAAFIACMRFYTVQRRDALRFDYFATDPGTAFLHPLLEKFLQAGGELFLGHQVTQLSRAEAGWRVHVETARGTRTLLADHVVLATHPPGAKTMLLAGEATRPIAETLTWPEGLPSGIVRLWFSAPPLPNRLEAGVLSGDFIVDNFFWLNHIQPEIRAWAERTGGSLLEMHLYQPLSFFQQPEAVIVARAIHDVYRIYPELRGQVVAHTLQRNSAVHTRLTVAPADQWLGVDTPWPNLWACGDWVRGPWPALFLERACVSGLTAANRVLAAHGQPPFPHETYSPPDALAGWIQRALLSGRAAVRRTLKKTP